MGLIFIFIFFVSNVLAQDNIRPLKPFIELGTYIHSGFEKSIIPNLNGGIEFRYNRYLKPEIGIGLMVAGIEEHSNYGTDGLLVDVNKTNVLASSMFFSPKIVLGKENSGTFYIIPFYTISNIQAVEQYLKYNHLDSSQSKEERYTEKEIQHSFGLGLGLEARFSEESIDSFLINIYLNGVDLGKTINKLPHNSEIFDTKYTLGIGLKYYFGIKKKSL